MKQKQGECEVTSFIIFKGKITRNAYRTPESFGNDTLPSDFPLLRPDTSAFRPSAETIPTQALSRGVPETQSFSIHSGKLRRSKLSEPATRKLRTSPRALFLETDSIMIKTQTDSIKSELLHSNSKVSKQKSKKLKRTWSTNTGCDRRKKHRKCESKSISTWVDEFATLESLSSPCLTPASFSSLDLDTQFATESSSTDFFSDYPLLRDEQNMSLSRSEISDFNFSDHLSGASSDLDFRTASSDIEDFLNPNLGPDDSCSSLFISPSSSPPSSFLSWPTAWAKESDVLSHLSAQMVS